MKKFSVSLLALLVAAITIVFVLPHTAVGSENVSAFPHSAEEILFRQQSARKLQQGECTPAPPEYVEKAAFIERARAFARELGVWSDDMYKCYDPTPEISLWIYFLNWVDATKVAGSRSSMGWLWANYSFEREMYVNILRKDIGEWNSVSLPDMSEEEMARLRSRLVEDRNAWNSRWTLGSVQKDISKDLFALPLNEITENLLHEGCHDFITVRGMTEIHGRADLEEALCTMYGFRAGMAFLVAGGQTAERETLVARYRWSLKRAVLFNSLWWQLAVAFDRGASEEERIRLRDEIFGRLTPDNLQYFSGVAPNTAIVSSMNTYTAFLLSAEELWQILTGEPPIDMNPPPEEGLAEGVM